MIRNVLLRNARFLYGIRIRSSGLVRLKPTRCPTFPLFPPQFRDFWVSTVHFEERTVKTPTFPDSVTEGEVRWSKKEGETVAEDEVVCEIETDKTAIPVIAPASGIIIKTFVPDGGSVQANSVLFTIDTAAGAPPKKDTTVGKPPPGKLPSKDPGSIPSKPKPEKAPQPSSQEMGPKPPSPEKASKSPKEKAPKQALPDKPKSTSQDVPPTSDQPPPPKKAPTSPPAESKPKSPPSDSKPKPPPGSRTESRVKLSRMRLRIGERLKGSQNTYAMLTTFNEVDMSSAKEFREQQQTAFTKKHGVKLGFMSAFIKAATYALQDNPIVNALIDGTDIVYHDYVDISVAIATPKGLVTPVIRNVETMNFADIEKELAQMAKKARAGSITIEDMNGGTFTISNGGVYGSLISTPIINPPQSAILGMHATVDRPVVRKGQIVIRPMMYLTLSYDHRLIDGRDAVLFLRKIKDCVEDPRIMLSGV